MPETYPPKTQILEQLSSQCIPSWQWLICSWAAACMLAIGQRACSGRIYNVIVLVQPSHIVIGNNAFLLIGKEIKSAVLDDFKVTLLSDNPPLKLSVELLEACFHHQEASWIWVLHLSIIIWLLSNIVDHILSWRWEEMIQTKIAAATKA